MKTTKLSSTRRQCGVVLFVALVTLVIIMLAAIALVRSVDTGNLIAGNVAFRRAATSSADSGVEAAIAWILAKEKQDVAKDAFTDATHVLNVTDANSGYYSSESNDPADASYINVMSSDVWKNGASASVAGTDASGNSVRYIIQRMCKTANQVLSETNCVFSDGQKNDNSMKTGTPLPEKSGLSVMYRVTARVTGPRNTVSYVQAFVY